MALPGTNTRVTDIVAAPDGLYACGWFDVAGAVPANRVARFDGSVWHALGEGVDDACTCLVTMPNGDIVVGGVFTNAGSVAAAHIARWDGSTWSPIGAGFNGIVHALCVLPNGDLVAGGSFTESGGQSIPKLARWDGSTWSDIGGSVTLGQVYALEVLPGGELAVGGTFQQAGQQASGTNATGLGIWDGANWTTPPTTPGKPILAFEVLANGDLAFAGTTDAPTDNLGIWDGQSVQYVTSPISGSVNDILLDSAGDLFVGGGATFGGEANTVARLSNGVWTAVDFGLNKVFGLAEWQGRLFAGGGAIGENQAPTVREYDGTDWLPVGGSTLPRNLSEVVAAPTGGAYVAGVFEEIGGVPASYVAEFDGSDWHVLGAGVDAPLTAMTTAPNGDLLVAGDFANAGGAPAARIARWNGTSWSTLGAGLPDPAVDLLVDSQGRVVALMPLAPFVQVFDGLAWTSLPDPVNQVSLPRSIVELPNGNLVITGVLAGTAALEWDGSSWTPLGSNGYGTTLLVDRSGDLLMCGVFSFGPGLGLWDGTSWNDVGSLGGLPGSIVELPSGDLIAVGPALLINPSVPGDIVRWDGQSWSVVDGGTSLSMGAATAIASVTMDSRGDLYCAGTFAAMGPNDAVSPRFARAVSECPATAAAFGAGCNGSAGPVSLVAVASQPWIGSTFAARVDGMAPSSLALHAIGTNPTIAPLPGGAPGCSLFVQPDLLELLVPVSGSADMTLSVPGNPSLVGLTLRTQAIGLELGAGFSITRITSSNALDLTIGAL